MVRKSVIWLLFFVLITSANFAQGDLEIFGFAQAKIQKFADDSKMTMDIALPSGEVMEVPIYEGKTNYTSSSVQQLNLFFRKELSDRFTSWVNLEFVNSFSSEKNWGALNLEEAWVSYKYNDLLNVKAGLLTPRFNYLNEVKNRMPLLPYITRPLIYETSLKAFFKTSNYLPERAFLQIYGNMPAGKLNLDYAVFAGSAEEDYINSSDTNRVLGADTVNLKTFGGRMGMRYDELRFGVSASFDKDNQQATIKEDVSRIKIGADLGYSFYNFFLEAEVIKVILDPKNSTENMDKLFYYALLGYNINEQVFAYGAYNYLEDATDLVLKGGFNSYLVGTGYRPIESVVLKGEYNIVKNDNKFSMVTDPSLPPMTGRVNWNTATYHFAISILF